jgi:hypothetical protein
MQKFGEEILGFWLDIFCEQIVPNHITVVEIESEIIQVPSDVIFKVTSAKRDVGVPL